MNDIPGTPLHPAAPAVSAEAGIGAPDIKAEVKPRKTAARDKPKAAEGKAVASGKERTYEITLHDSNEVPPGGQIIGVNGVQYRIPAGRRCKVPASVLEVLNNAIQDVPQLNDNGSVIGWRSAPRLTYTLHVDSVEAA